MKQKVLEYEKISIMIPCYNEVENVEIIAQAVVQVFHDKLTEYEYELLFIDNACSSL